MHLKRGNLNLKWWILHSDSNRQKQYDAFQRSGSFLQLSDSERVDLSQVNVH